MWGYDEENHNRQVLSIDVAPCEGVNQLHPLKLCSFHCYGYQIGAATSDSLTCGVSDVAWSNHREMWCSMKCRKMNSFNRSMCELILDLSCHTLQKLTICVHLM